MINVAICDDNDAMLNFLKNIINDIFTENELNFKLHTFLSGAEFLKRHEEEPFDVVFLDIVMPEIDGFEAAKQMRKISSGTYIIFITTESSLVYESFDFQPFYFIPKGKPQVVEERLRHVVGKLKVHIAANKKILIDGAYNNKRYVSPSDILYIKSSSNQVIFHFTNGETMQIRNKLSNLFATLNNNIFTKTHNRFVVNMKHIEQVDYPNMQIMLYNREIIPISRNCKKEFEKNYIMFMRSFS